MVNITIVSRYSGPLPEGVDPDRSIPGGPLYQTEEILEIVTREGCQAIIPWSNGCVADVQRLSLDEEDILELVKLALRNGAYLGSEWCVQRPNGPWAACDAYSVKVLEWDSKMHKQIEIEYYIKLAINIRGTKLLFASSHPSGE